MPLSSHSCSVNYRIEIHLWNIYDGDDDHEDHNHDDHEDHNHDGHFKPDGVPVHSVLSPPHTLADVDYDDNHYAGDDNHDGDDDVYNDDDDDDDEWVEGRCL